MASPSTLMHLLLAASMGLAAPAGGAVLPAEIVTMATAARAIDALMAQINAAKKPLPVWIVDTAARIYAAYKQYRNGERVEAIEAATLAALKEIASIKSSVESGRELTANEYRLARELIDAHEHRITDHAMRIGNLEVAAREAKAREAAAQRRVAELERAAIATDARVLVWQKRAADAERTAREARSVTGRRGCGFAHAWRDGRCVNVVDNPR